MTGSGTLIVMTIDISEVALLREEWRSKGNPPCSHPRSVEVSSQGLPTGTTACMICGFDGDDVDWEDKPKAGDDDGNSW